MRQVTHGNSGRVTKLNSPASTRCDAAPVVQRICQCAVATYNATYPKFDQCSAFELDSVQCLAGELQDKRCVSQYSSILLLSAPVPPRS